ncbi:SMP-30/Gluconolaconase/LRE-like region-containing protein [Actinopolyspora xinjiangensis]|uniref:SMP-30/Gluconolaconase/LRE-like region-containing protein n=1 Tax=Actinopolyspora xinjiangensis TaxID=405564 RepID=A0A1H0WTD7_9ACTN|nr:SMP-30/gluconolactonase/LRE family protein [Actinopolyspora xinjiangensis]SDP93971.1 SMP-30/Gluconolaconase/LRE-like region-containing protein [Actinopolyspora xinjiangensis]
MSPGIRPRGWRPPPPRPGRARRIAAPGLLPVNGLGPEDVAVDRHERVITGVDDGRLLAVDPAGGPSRTVADTGGRPLGIETLPDGQLLVCDAERGLLRVDPERATVRTLLASDERAGPALCNNAAVARDGTVYFSDSSRRFPLARWRDDLMEHSGTGRLWRLPPDGDAEVVLDGLQFANGVALTPDESSVVVAETGAYRLRRVLLDGPRTGCDDTLFSAMAGFPDNISTGPDGLIWVTQAAARSRLLDTAHAHAPALLRLAAALPPPLQVQPTETLWLLAVDPHGQVVHELSADPTGFGMVTGVRRHRDSLYLGSLTSRAVAVLPLPPDVAG